ncbi:MAG: peptidase T [Clostridium sp.]|jgi:tripeptide aminopeptidase
MKSVKSVLDRFLEYVSFDTQSDENSETVPSTGKQRLLAQVLAEELEAMGASEVTVTETGYVTAVLPATCEEKIPSLGWIAHMDTSPALSGKNVKPRIVKKYLGGDICLNETRDIWLREKEFPFLSDCTGEDLVVTDGTTLLGADDKAGIAEIMTMAEYFLAHPEIPRGKLCIGFTPDEEIGRGPDHFDVKAFGADVAYTVDGGPLGELEYENFNAASGTLRIHGKSIHPGSGKNQMINALLIGMEFQSLLPAFENPMYTEGYEGFYHLDGFSGGVEEAKMDYIIRDHDRGKFEQKKEFFQSAADFLNKKYGEGTVEIEIRDSYYNMKEKIMPFFYLIELARTAMERQGVTPIIVPIRGGTDGARLSFMGLPCPNLCTGGYNYHGKYECIPVASMEKTTDILISMVQEFYKYFK